MNIVRKVEIGRKEVLFKVSAAIPGDVEEWLNDYTFSIYQVLWGLSNYEG